MGLSRSQIRRRSLLARGLCVDCESVPLKRRDDGTMPATCPVCADRHRDQDRKYRDRKRAEADASGMCTTCFKNPARPGLRTCGPCKESRVKNRNSRQCVAVSIRTGERCRRFAMTGSDRCASHRGVAIREGGDA